MSVSKILIPVFQNEDVLLYTAEYLSGKEIIAMDLVCKGWHSAFDKRDFWYKIYQKELIPLVQGENRNLRADLKKLYPITLSGAKISKYIGQFIGEIPHIRLDCFNFLFRADPYNKRKKMGVNYEVIVVPQAILRTFDSRFTAIINNQGQLVIKPTKSDEVLLEQTPLLIPFSFPNLVELSKYPLSGGKHGPVFRYIDPVILDQCTSSAEKVKIFLMRKCIIKKSRNQLYSMHKKNAKKHGLEITPLITRALSNTIKILESGKCRDYALAEKNFVYARTSDSVKSNNHNFYQVDVGAHNKKAGMNIITFLSHHQNVGSAPCIPAEVSCVPAHRE